MVLSKYFLFATLLMALVQGDDNNPTGFLSIDCGSLDSSYVDETTGFTYHSDEGFTETGENREIVNAYKVQLQTNERQFRNVRSFPEGIRNCYTLKPTLGDQGTRYMIRARFMYGNYDNENLAPTFDLYLGVDFWDTVLTQHAWNRVNKEIIFFPKSDDHLYVCLVNTGHGFPFISALELRPWVDGNQTYVSKSGSLGLFQRSDLNPAIDQVMRYKEDVYDRLWSPLTGDNRFVPINTTKGNNITKNIYQLPSPIMRTAYEPNITIHDDNLGILIDPSNSSAPLLYYFYFHFAEIQELRKNESREFTISINGNLTHGPLVPIYLVTNTVISTSGGTNSDGKIHVWLNRTQNSTKPPLLNALEVYWLTEFTQQETNQADVNAIQNIKSAYQVTKNWQGDPCAPKAFLWDGLGCSYGGNSSPRIISLNLSSSGLNGVISPYFSDLTMLQALDLSNNSLSGTVPEFLANLSSLRILNLKKNKLEGPLPSALLERSNDGLSLSVDANVMGNLTPPPTTNQTSSSAEDWCRKNKFVVSLVASVEAFLLQFVLSTS
ncbi:hypothetical protein TIFTF001_006525 [Ficus carica]|uniref:Malectin-like domain-containing protein n=1 Tax=Ficus carica TaxID=3494 RepID=A0AA87ZPI2_FICCA|nr:hypothetical protein TIFTF001_006525 [Ficus carica]